MMDNLAGVSAKDLVDLTGAAKLDAIVNDELDLFKNRAADTDDDTIDASGEILIADIEM